MAIRPIRNDADHAEALAAIDELWGAEPESADGDRLEVLLTLVDAYEARHHRINPPNAIDAILFRKQQGP